MAALTRRKEATYEVHEKVKVDTQDNEDHTFCGIMFPVKCKAVLPVERVIIHSLSVRGQLGPITVWVSKAPENGKSTNCFRLSKRFWDKVYEKTHEPSQSVYKTLTLEEPIIMKPGQVRAIYIHSSLPGDQAIVYDNTYVYMPRSDSASRFRHDDDMLTIFTGRAHVSNIPFGQMPIWGWGNAWRDQREFVGQLEYGAIYQLWNPETRNLFGPKFHDMMKLLFMCQRRWESPFSMLPDECICYILNMCRWDWFDDCTTAMEHKRRRIQARAAQEEEVERQGSMDTADTGATDDGDNDIDEEDDEDYEEMDEEEDEDDDLSSGSDDDQSWEVSHGYRADNNVFRFEDPTNPTDHSSQAGESSPGRQAWIRRQIARIHIMRALAGPQIDGDGDEEDDLFQMLFTR